MTLAEDFGHMFVQPFQLMLRGEDDFLLLLLQQLYGILFFGGDPSWRSNSRGFGGLGRHVEGWCPNALEQWLNGSEGGHLRLR